ncbi:DUF3050 domain-containing protein [Sphingobacterium spiritivorum]|uniref:Heme oxygenase n=1 Tax=Sphingobacterium spiritivorum ATCC 33861 TaxID=525373 RepID=D7VM16_SPHSI|nr:DUF3050 domain-containing protein [Sphingobacterium spiritivorum]EFK58021.1 hypothetical protein HMPREF0766_12013 [Sphingobacterium spiritivorum ATCC 33861]QQT34717.1 DUF3050 domain-containing protein [Sphingobacterium spiritivorum]WQD35601.1 DUF3050 domain-containing protein [Sphingobacterium spiritivorum]SUJ00949.1 Protein of uncharacterised function (DUF3050) [Sphingobacterium spiritivorum]
MDRIQEVQDYIQTERDVLLKHPLYEKLNDLESLKHFTEVHVYAVWDFMSLLKALQVKLTCTQVPWFASAYPNTRYLINEIVLAEESDEYIDGSRLSHFEMYLDAMLTIGADPQAMLDFINSLRNGENIHTAIDAVKLDIRIKDFLNFTFDTIAKGGAHEIASAFTFGREDLIPGMFTSMLSNIQNNSPAVDLSKLIYYFDRHISLDGDEHGPLAMQMIAELAGEDENKWQDIKNTAKTALQKRIALWDAINDGLA